MQQRLLIAGGVLVIALAAAWLLARRRADPPTQDPNRVPSMVDRADFARPDAAWLIVVFTSATCASCAAATAAMAALARSDVAYVEVPWLEARAIHDRYRIESVPLILIADRDGVVQASCEGARAAELAALAQAVDNMAGNAGQG
jgi:hypothetical protein